MVMVINMVHTNVYFSEDFVFRHLYLFFVCLLFDAKKMLQAVTDISVDKYSSNNLKSKSHKYLSDNKFHNLNIAVVQGDHKSKATGCPSVNQVSNALTWAKHVI